MRLEPRSVISCALNIQIIRKIPDSIRVLAHAVIINSLAVLRLSLSLSLSLSLTLALALQRRTRTEHVRRDAYETRIVRRSETRETRGESERETVPSVIVKQHFTFKWANI